MNRNFDIINLPADRTAVSPHPPATVPSEILVAIAAGLPVPVAPGRHPAPGDEACLMELASALAREPWSDHPACVHPVLAAVARAVNDRVGDAAREWLAPLLPRMIGTADAGPDRRPRPERCAELVLLCARTALRLSPFMAAEMESARLTALSVLSRHDGNSGTAVRRRTTALLDRLGLLSRVYPRQAAVEAAQAVSVIAGARPAAIRPAAARRDAQLGELLRACTALCADDVPAPAPRRDVNVQDPLTAGG
jgi:hypothetical protein